MSFSFQNQGFNTFLCYEIDEGKTLDAVSIAMLTNNKINGFAQTAFSQSDSKRFLKFNVTSKVSARQFFFGTITKSRMLNVFTGIVKAYLTSEEYMIDSNSIIFDLDYIFVNVSTCEVVVICLPVSDSGFVNDYRNFFRDILLNCHIDQSENCDYYGKLLNYFNLVEKLNFEELNNFLNTLNGNTTVNSDISSAVSGTIKAETGDFSVNIPVSSGNIIPQPYVSASNGNDGFQSVTTPVAPSYPSVVPPVVGGSRPVVPPVNPVQSTPPVVPVPPVAPPAKGKEEEKKSGGLFGFLHKDKKAKTEKDSGSTITSKNNGFNGVVIPGQVVPPTVKGAESNIAGKAVPPVKPQVPPMPAMKPQAPTVAPPPVVPRPVVPQPVTPPPVAPQPVAPQPVTPSPVASQPLPFNNMNFGETTVLNSGIGETTVLGVDMNASIAPTPYLIRSKNNEKILISKPVFRIGKEKSYVDYFIGDNTAISRSHANIISKDNEYFIVDTNSTNHTYVDGVMAQSNVEIKLKHGVNIRLANEDFEFKLY